MRKEEGRRRKKKKGEVVGASNDEVRSGGRMTSVASAHIGQVEESDHSRATRILCVLGACVECGMFASSGTSLVEPHFPCRAFVHCSPSSLFITCTIGLCSRQPPCYY